MMFSCFLFRTFDQRARFLERFAYTFASFIGFSQLWEFSLGLFGLSRNKSTSNLYTQIWASTNDFIEMIQVHKDNTSKTQKV